MSETTATTDPLLAWAEKLAGNNQVVVRSCRPGEPIVVTYSSGEGIWGRGRYEAQAEAVYPAPVWGLVAPSRPDNSPRAQRRCQPPVTEPTLYYVVETGQGAGSTSEGKPNNYQRNLFMLVVPLGEREEDYQKRLRREFADRQRDRLRAIGVTPGTIQAIFDGAGVKWAVEGVKWALRTLIACGGEDRQAAVNLLAEVSDAPYGRDRRLKRLDDAGVDCSEVPYNPQVLNAQLRAAVVFAQAHWHVTPQKEPEPETEEDLLSDLDNLLK